MWIPYMYLYCRERLLASESGGSPVTSLYLYYINVECRYHICIYIVGKDCWHLNQENNTLCHFISTMNVEYRYHICIYLYCRERLLASQSGE